MAKCPICFFPLQGGGATIKDVYAKEIALAQHFCLAVMDGDKRYPDDQYGQTSEELINIHNKENPFNCTYYRMERVCEIENLIPLPVIGAYKNNKSKKVFQLNLQSKLSYFDMKKGFACCNINSGNMYDFWKNIFDDYNDLRDKLPDCLDCLKNHNYKISKEDRKDCDKLTVLDGFGSDLMKDLLNDGKSMNDLKNIKSGQLTEEQQKEWLAIGKIIFEWCCAGEKVRV